jgi:thiamine-monophosphate kinase
VSHLELGPGREFDAIRSLVARWGPLAVGVGGDCAVLDVPAGRLVISTDTSVEGVHFRRDWMTPADIGYRATTAALSDLAAAAAAPVGILVAITVPHDWQGDLGAVADGIGEAARLVGTVILGGDTTRGPVLSLTVTVVGAAERPLTRSGAQVGDHVYVTGAFGGPAAAVRALEAGQRPSAPVMARFIRPAARIAEARWLVDRGAVAAIDVSDGLAGDLAHLAAAGGVRLSIDLGRVPRIAGAADEVTLADVVAGGEEYELAVAAPAGLDTSLFHQAFGLPLTDIGWASAAGAEGPGVEFSVDGRRVDPPRSWDHFSE